MNNEVNTVGHTNIRPVSPLCPTNVLLSPPFPCCPWEHLDFDEVVQRQIHQIRILNVLLNNLEFVAWWWFRRHDGQGRKDTREIFFMICWKKVGEKRIHFEGL